MIQLRTTGCRLESCEPAGYYLRYRMPNPGLCHMYRARKIQSPLSVRAQNREGGDVAVRRDVCILFHLRQHVPHNLPCGGIGVWAGGAISGNIFTASETRKGNGQNARKGTKRRAKGNKTEPSHRCYIVHNARCSRGAAAHSTVCIGLQGKHQDTRAVQPPRAGNRGCSSSYMVSKFRLSVRSEMNRRGR